MTKDPFKAALESDLKAASQFVEDLLELCNRHTRYSALCGDFDEVVAGIQKIQRRVKNMKNEESK